MSLLLIAAFVFQPDVTGELSRLLEEARPDNTKQVRLTALGKLKDVGKSDPKQTSDSLVPYLSEPDAEIRSEAAVAIGLSGYETEICPPALIKGVDDPDELVRTNVTGIVGLYTRFPKEAAPILLAAAKSKNASIRSSIPSLLGHAVGKTPMVLKRLELMFEDSDFRVRNNAHAAHFNLTGGMKAYVPHLLQITADREKDPEPQTEEQQRKSSYLEFLATAGAIQVYEQSRLRPDDLARELVNNLTHEAPTIRRCALRHLRAMCISSKTTFRTVAKLELQKKLEAIADKDGDETVCSWAHSVRDILQEGPPEDAPETLKPFAELNPQPSLEQLEPEAMP